MNQFREHGLRSADKANWFLKSCNSLGSSRLWNSYRMFCCFKRLGRSNYKCEQAVINNVWLTSGFNKKQQS